MQFSREAAVLVRGLAAVLVRCAVDRPCDVGALRCWCCARLVSCALGAKRGWQFAVAAVRRSPFPPIVRPWGIDKLSPGRHCPTHRLSMEDMGNSAELLPGTLD